MARAGVATSFPQIIGVASSFNASLFHAIGRATGLEARGLNNGLSGALYRGLTMWSPNVNLYRDPRWGRGQETAGEDPLLSGIWAARFVRGLQGASEEEGDDDDDVYDDGHGDAGSGHAKGRAPPPPLLASAALKHFAAYDLEDGRMTLQAEAR